MTLKGWLLLLLAAALFAAGFCTASCRTNHAIAAGVAVANKIDATAQAALSQGVQHAQDAQAKGPGIQADLAAVAKDRAQLVVDQARAPRPVPHPAVPGSTAPAPEPVETPAQVAVDQDKDRLISDQAKTITDQGAQIADMKSAVRDLQLGANGLKAEVVQLRSTITTLQGQQRPWAMGVAYGTDGTIGGSVDRDLGPFRAGVDVVRRSIGGGQTTIEAIGRVSFRF